MNCPTTQRALLVANGQYGIAHLSDAIEETEYLVQYALSDTLDSPDRFWADVIRNGKTLVLTPGNTPLILNIPGAYRLIEHSPSGGIVRLAAFNVMGSVPGAIK